MPKQATAETPKLVMIPLAAISPSTKNPRATLNKKAFDELKASVFSNGLLQPIAVRVVDDKYEIVGGHRRFHAFKELAHAYPDDARFVNVPALIIDAGDERVAALRLAENINREDLSEPEIAEGIVDALETGMTQEELAERLGWAKRNVYRYTQFHAAPAWLKDFTSAVPVPEKKLDETGHAVIDATTEAPVVTIKELAPLSFTHVFELITLFNVLHQHDVQQVDELGASYKPQAERITRKLARKAAQEEWSTARLRTEIARLKDPPRDATSSRTKKVGGAQKMSAPFVVTKENVAIDLTRAFNDKERDALANALTEALSALGIMAVKLDEAR